METKGKRVKASKLGGVGVREAVGGVSQQPTGEEPAGRKVWGEGPGSRPRLGVLWPSSSHASAAHPTVCL